MGYINLFCSVLQLLVFFLGKKGKIHGQRDASERQGNTPFQSFAFTSLIVRIAILNFTAVIECCTLSGEWMLTDIAEDRGKVFLDAVI